MAVPRMTNLLSLILLLGCNSQTSVPSEMASNIESGTKHHLPLIRSAEIIPSPLTLEGPVSVHVTTESSGQSETKLKYNWFVNEVAVPGNGEGRLMPESLKQGDQIYVEIIPSAGKQEGPLFRTPPTVVVNTPPWVKDIVFQLSQAKAGDKVQVKVDAVDPDGEDIRLRFKWWRNERLVSEGDDSVLDTAGYVRGDRIVVSVTPHDHDSRGKEFFSQPYTLSNGSPHIITPGDPAIVEGHLRYTIKAVDPENDPLTFSLETAPADMTIDERTGRINWLIPKEAKGTFRVRVMVKDDHEGWASQELELIPPPRQTAS